MLKLWLLTAMNLTDFRGNAQLKLQVAGPFLGGSVDIPAEESILIQVSQIEEAGSRRRRGQQVSDLLDITPTDHKLSPAQNHI